MPDNPVARLCLIAALALSGCAPYWPQPYYSVTAGVGAYRPQSYYSTTAGAYGTGSPYGPQPYNYPTVGVYADPTYGTWHSNVDYPRRH